MRAWIVERLTPEGEMRLAEVPTPVPTGSQSLVKVEAAGINFLDTLVIKGQYQVKPPLPFTPGVETAGTVVAIGPESPFDIGDRLCSSGGFGGFAEFAIAEAEGSVKLPPEMSSRDAVALPTIYPTAHLALKDRAQLKFGEKVLVTAGAGGVGSATIQLAKHWGARVIAAAGGPEKTAICRELGADVAIDYTAEPLVDAVRKIAGAEGVDVVVDSVGGKTAIDALRCLGWGGRLVIVGFAGGTIPELPANRLLLKNASALGVFWGEYRKHEPEQVKLLFDDLFELYRQGAIKPLIRDVFPMADGRKAIDALAARKTVGKAVVEPQA